MSAHPVFVPLEGDTLGKPKQLMQSACCKSTSMKSVTVKGYQWQGAVMCVVPGSLTFFPLAAHAIHRDDCKREGCEVKGSLVATDAFHIEDARAPQLGAPGFVRRSSLSSIAVGRRPTPCSTTPAPPSAGALPRPARGGVSRRPGCPPQRVSMRDVRGRGQRTARTSCGGWAAFGCGIARLCLLTAADGNECGRGLGLGGAVRAGAAHGAAERIPT
ncbi:hypothetical protein C8R44DRAFT_746008 [Mycena epipterygia]|nr:hypothetical protein C8R44DRAFT_746008 [Mycena epipterygia]